MARTLRDVLVGLAISPTRLYVNNVPVERVFRTVDPDCYRLQVDAKLDDSLHVNLREVNVLAGSAYFHDLDGTLYHLTVYDYAPLDTAS